jgi:tetratricopeptide (TPR) repeat protein
MLRPFQLCAAIDLRLNRKSFSLDSMLPPPSQPVAPEIFYGRDEYVTEITRLIIHKEQTRIAIMGTGGMGKTTVALHIMHHPDVATKYSSRRYFVGCDAVDSADTLALLILKTLQIPPFSGKNSVDVLHRSLSNASSTLIVLDNFETVWNADKNHAAVRDLLQKIASVISVSLILTSRGDLPPQGIKWTRSDDLPPLSLEAAKSCFWDLSSGVDKNAEETQSLDILLGELDYIPFAIHLIAQSCSGFAPGYMLKLWREKKTALLQTRIDAPDKLESIEVSISLSISGLQNADHHEAIRLLSILCLLPDGLHRWQEQLPLTAIKTKFENVHQLLQSLRRTSLVFFARRTLKVLSPIRHFVNSSLPASENDVKSLEAYFWDQANKFAAIEPGEGFIQAKEILEPEMGNLRSLLHNAVQKHPSVEVIQVTANISQFLSRTHPSTDLLDLVKHLVVDIAPPILTAQFHQCMGENLYKLSHFGEATEPFWQARELYTAASDGLGAVYCLLMLGDILRLQEKYGEAKDVFTRAKQEYLENGDPIGSTRCSQSLGEVLFDSGDYQGAIDVMTACHADFIKMKNPIGAAYSSRTLARALNRQSKYDEATDTATEARKLFVECGAENQAMHCSNILGNILLKQGQVTEALETLTEARERFLSIGESLGIANCAKSLGEVYLAQSNPGKAFEMFREARDLYLTIGIQIQVEYCSERMDISLQESNGGSL